MKKNAYHMNVKRVNKMNPLETSPNPIQSVRCNYVDWVRVMAMVMVFILHCSRFFDLIGWHVKNPQTYMGFTLILLFFHQWTMPLFFLLSGAATWFYLQKHTGGEYTRARLKRLLIPYILGILVIIPPQKFLEAVTQRNFSGSYSEFLGRYFSLNTLWIDPTLQFLGYYGYHLWFLGFLLVFSIAALPLFKLLRKEKSARLISQWGPFFNRPGRIFLLFLPIAFVQITLRPLFPQYLNWADTFYWFIFFFYGYLMFSNRQFGESMARYWKAALFIGMGCFLILVGWAYWGDIRQLETNPGYSIVDTVYQTLRSINTWAWVVFMLGMAKKYINRNSKTLKYCNQAILPFYIFHQTVILIIGFYVVQWNIPVISKFAIILCTAFMATLILYELVKRFSLTRFLFGMKKNRIK